MWTSRITHQVVGCPSTVSLSAVQCGHDCCSVLVSVKIILIWRFVPGLMTKFQGCWSMLNFLFDSKSCSWNSPFRIFAEPLSLYFSSSRLRVFHSMTILNTYHKLAKIILFYYNVVLCSLKHPISIQHRMGSAHLKHRTEQRVDLVGLVAGDSGPIL